MAKAGRKKKQVTSREWEYCYQLWGNKVLTIEQLAEVLGVCNKTARMWLEKTIMNSGCFNNLDFLSDWKEYIKENPIYDINKKD